MARLWFARGRRLLPRGGWLSLTPYWIGKARKAARAGDWEAASQAYEKSLGISPNLARAWAQYGHVLKEQGDLRGAERAYSVSIQLEPSAEIFVHLGHVLLRRARASEAAQA